ncbi:MAG: helicase [Candidatus Paceibacterota bacterium]
MKSQTNTVKSSTIPIKIDFINHEKQKGGGVIDYGEYISNKRHSVFNYGFEPLFLPDCMFDFQKFLTRWAITTGRSALFQDCGLGKTLQELVWAKNVSMHTGKKVLIITPLAVSAQTVSEGEKFGINAQRSQDGKCSCDIVVTNYERLQYFKPEDFSGVVCDESSILKNFDGKYKADITEFMRRSEYRLLGTATAAPNDFIELGTSSEALGFLGYMDMLSRFFKSDTDNISQKRRYGEAPKWRFKKHAETPFWRWVTSWARAIRKPSDIGFDDGGFKLTKLIERLHMVEAKTLPEGYFLPVHARDRAEQLAEKRRTIEERCDMVLQCVKNRTDQSSVWCQLDAEGDLLEKIIPNSIQVHGRLKDEVKEEYYTKFSKGEIQRIILKPKMGAFGLNWQNCHHFTWFPEHSYERKYQLTRRHLRFGQKHDVEGDIIMTEGERKILNNVKRKDVQASQMFDGLVKEMNNCLSIKNHIEHTTKEILPSWLS